MLQRYVMRTMSTDCNKFVSITNTLRDSKLVCQIVAKLHFFVGNNKSSATI